MFGFFVVVVVFFSGCIEWEHWAEWVTELVYLKDTHCQSLDCTMGSTDEPKFTVITVARVNGIPKYTLSSALGSYLWNQIRIRGKQIEINESFRVSEKVATKTKRNPRRNQMIKKLGDVNKEYFLKETVTKGSTGNSICENG